MRFVPVKTAARQAILLQHRTRDLLVRQMTRTAKAIRAHLAEFGVVAPAGVRNVDHLLETAARSAPEHAMEAIDVLAGQFTETRARVDEITCRIEQAIKKRRPRVTSAGRSESGERYATPCDISGANRLPAVSRAVRRMRRKVMPGTPAAPR